MSIQTIEVGVLAVLFILFVVPNLIMRIILLCVIIRIEKRVTFILRTMNTWMPFPILCILVYRDITLENVASIKILHIILHNMEKSGKLLSREYPVSPAEEEIFAHGNKLMEWRYGPGLPRRYRKLRKETKVKFGFGGQIPQPA